MSTIIIGAGLAGLAAAERLAREDREVMLVDARHRVGGRVLTWSNSGVSLDLGAEWISNRGAVRELLERHEVELRDAEGSRFSRDGDGWRNLDDLPDVTTGLRERAERGIGGSDRSLGDALRDCCAGSDDEAARAMLVAYVEGFHAADAERVSMRWLGVVERNQPADASPLRAPLGASTAVYALRGACEGHCTFRLGTRVTDVKWRKGSVEVSAQAAEGAISMRAKSAIITLPLPILKAPDSAGSVRFDPPLAAKLEALDLLEMGSALKVYLEFAEPFWWDHVPESLLFLFNTGSPLPVWWLPVDREQPFMAGWVGGPAADVLSRNAGLDLTGHAVDSLAAGLGVSHALVRRHLVGTHLHDWRADPFTRGAYSYVAVGGDNAHARLAEPLDETLYFAGEATAGGGLNATMEGAIESGRRAAEQILAS